MYWSDFLGQKSVVVAEIWSFSAILDHFSATATDFDPKNQIFKNLINTYFLITFTYNLAKFQVYRTSKSPEIAQNVKCQFRLFKVSEAKTIFGSRNHHFRLFLAHIFIYKVCREKSDFRHTRPHSNANILS